MVDHEFDCTVCGEDFVCADDNLADPSWVLACPCCGSTEVSRAVWDTELDRLTAA